MIKTIDHIGILTKDLQKSVEFYTDVLGFSISAKIEMDKVSSIPSPHCYIYKER